MGAALASVAANLNGFAGGLSAGNADAVAFWVFATALPLAVVRLLAQREPWPALQARS